MLTIDDAIQFLLSDESNLIQIKKCNVLKNRTISSLDNINTDKNNIIECFLFYLKNNLINFENYDNDTICDSFLKFFKLKIMEKNFIKSLNIDFPIKKQLYLRSIENNLNDCFGILFLSEFFNINVVISVNDQNYIIVDNKSIDKYKPYIILVYYENENVFLPTFEFGNKEVSLNHIEFSKILQDINIVNINLKNANTKIVSLQKQIKEIEEIEEIKEINSDTSLIDSESSEEIDDEVKNLISKTDSQLMKEKKELLLTVIGRLKLYQSGYENKKKLELVSIIRTYNN